MTQGTLPMSVAVPPLGLSNKATSDSQHQLSNLAFHWDILVIGILQLPISISALRRPFEAKLPSLTSWPEVEKVGFLNLCCCVLPQWMPDNRVLLL